MLCDVGLEMVDGCMMEVMSWYGMVWQEDVEMV